MNRRHPRLLTAATIAVLLGLVPWTSSTTAAAQGIPNKQYSEGAAITNQNLNAMFGVLQRMSWLKPDKAGDIDAHARLVPDWEGEPDTQILVLHDQDADGKRVAVRWRIPGTKKQGLCVNKRGKDYNGTGSGAGTWCTFDVPEGKRLVYRIGSCDNDKAPCGNVTNWVSKLDNWNWQRMTRRPYMVRGWMDYKDDADNDERNGCTEIGDEREDC